MEGDSFIRSTWHLSPWPTQGWVGFGLPGVIFPSEMVQTSLLLLLLLLSARLPCTYCMPTVCLLRASFPHTSNTPHTLTYKPDFFIPSTPPHPQKLNTHTHTRSLSTLVADWQTPDTDLCLQASWGHVLLPSRLLRANAVVRASWKSFMPTQITQAQGGT